MNKKIIFVSALAIMLVGGGAAYLVLSNDNKSDMIASESSVSTSASSSELETKKDTAESKAQSEGKYVEYSEAALADAEGTKILFFHASWCPQCTALEADFENSGVPKGVTVLEVDYDTNQALRQKYGVTIQTTLVRVDDDGNLVKKFVAYDEPSVSAVQDNLL